MEFNLNSLNDIPETFITRNSIEWKTARLSGNILYHRLLYSRLQLYDFCIQFLLGACERSFSWLNLWQQLLTQSFCKSLSFYSFKVNSVVRVCKEVGRLATFTKAIIRIFAFPRSLWSKKNEGALRENTAWLQLSFLTPFFCHHFFFFPFCPEDVSCRCLEGEKKLFS